MARPRALPCPSIIRPKLLTAASIPPKGDDWLTENKMDGFRLMVRIDQGVTLFTKNGYDWTKRMPTLAKELQTLPVRTAWLDGEVVVQNAEGIPVFHRLQSAFNSGNTADLRIWVFDLLFINGVDLRGLPLKERRSQLCDLMSEVDLEHVRVSEILDADPRDLLHNICVMGMEGIVCKKAGSPYTSDRNGDWIKVKCHNSREFIIVGYTRGFAGIGSLLLALHDQDGALLYAGRVRSGFDNRTLSTLLARLSLLVVPACPLPSPSKSSKTTIVWVKPQVVCEVKYAEITPNGKVRHPVFKGLRDDIPAADIGLF